MKLSNKNIYKDHKFVDFYKEVENYAYLQGIPNSDVLRARADVEITFIAGLSAEQAYYIIFENYGGTYE